MKNKTASVNHLRTHSIGELAVGVRERSGREYGNLHFGELIRAYVTLNNGYRNMAYVLKCEDGKERSYQHIKKLKLEDMALVKELRAKYIAHNWTQDEEKQLTTLLYCKPVEPRCEDCGHVGFVQLEMFAHKMFCEFYGTSHPKATECKHFVEAR